MTVARGGLPDGWSERHKSELSVPLPPGATFWGTPGHGYLMVDLRLLPAKVSSYDYLYGPHHVLLEEDCSLTMWLAEMGLIPMDPYIADMIERIPRQEAR